MGLKVIVVDDTILFRTVITDVLRTIPGVDIVGSAASGKVALAKIAELKPDLVTLDIEMPGMDGLQVLDEMRKSNFDTGVIIVSSYTSRGSSQTMRALEKGAFDFITKPASGSAEQNRAAVLEALVPRVKAFERRREITKILQRPSSPSLPPKPVRAAADRISPVQAPSDLNAVEKSMQRIAGVRKPEMVLIGVSTGGPVALAQLLPALPADLGVPIVIVQHMPPMFTRALAESLRDKCAISVCEAADGDQLRPGVAYIAPGGRQMKLESHSSGQASIVITDDPPENNCKPSVDYLFRSAAHLFPGRSMAIILTGMGNDGTIGLRLLKRHNCLVIAQDEASCVVYGMPKSAVDAGVVDVSLPLDQIASRIVYTVRGAI